MPLPGVRPEELSGNLIVVEGTDGSGRSTQISLLTEWLECEGFAVQTMGLRRSFLVGEDIDALLAENAVTRMTLALMYGTDFFDQLERRILPALRSGLIVLADRYIFTLIARAAVRGIGRDYLHGVYEIALRPDLTFWLNVRPEVAFDREFKKSQTISYWESGRDMSLSNDLFKSFIRYQSMIKREFEYLSKRHDFIELDGEGSVSRVNQLLAQANRFASGDSGHALQAFARPRASLALKSGRTGTTRLNRRRFKRDPAGHRASHFSPAHRDSGGRARRGATGP